MDKTIVCKDCGAEFVFTEKEQQFYASKNFKEPVRCKACRDALKAQKAFKGEAEKVGIYSDDDVQKLVDEIRKNK